MSNTATMIETIAGTAAATCVVIGAAGKAARSAYRWLSRVEGVITTVEKRSQQLVPNGGSSMRDSVDQIREDIRLLGERIDQVTQATPPTAGE